MTAARSPAVALMGVLLVLLAAGGLRDGRYFCWMMREVTRACCCGHDEARAGVPAGDSCHRLEARKCCELVQGDAEVVPAALRDGTVRVPVVALAVVLAAPLAAPAPDVRVIAWEGARSRAPPPSTSLFLRNCAFLI